MVGAWGLIWREVEVEVEVEVSVCMCVSDSPGFMHLPFGV